MARAISARALRSHAIRALKEAIAMALEKGDHAAAGAFAIRLEQMANRLAKANQPDQPAENEPTISIGKPGL